MNEKNHEEPSFDHPFFTQLVDFEASLSCETSKNHNDDESMVTVGRMLQDLMTIVNANEKVLYPLTLFGIAVYNKAREFTSYLHQSFYSKRFQHQVKALSALTRYWGCQLLRHASTTTPTFNATMDLLRSWGRTGLVFTTLAVDAASLTQSKSRYNIINTTTTLCVYFSRVSMSCLNHHEV